MSGQAVFHLSENKEYPINQNQIEYGCGNVQFVKGEAAGCDHSGHSGNIHDGDDGNQRCGLKQKNDLVGISRPCQTKGLGKN
jgi:hypothetical protein